jgi:hypothetical protein
VTHSGTAEVASVVFAVEDEGEACLDEVGLGEGFGFFAERLNLPAIDYAHGLRPCGSGLDAAHTGSLAELAADCIDEEDSGHGSSILAEASAHSPAQRLYYGLMATFAYPRQIPAKRPGQTDEEFAGEMRSMGLRKVECWVPDLSNPNVLEEYERQLRKLAEHQRRHPDELIALSGEDLAGWR